MKLDSHAVLPTALVLWMAALAAVMWNRLPERVPVPWGDPASRTSILLVPLLIALAAHLLVLAVKGGAVLSTLRTSLVAFLAGITGALALLGGAQDIDGLRLGVLAVGFLQVVLSRALPLLKPGGIGLRLPWTLKSRASWESTHRLAGLLLLASGLVTILQAVLDVRAGAFSLVLLTAATVAVSVVHAFRVWSRDPARER